MSIPSYKECLSGIQAIKDKPGACTENGLGEQVLTDGMDARRVSDLARLGLQSLVSEASPAERGFYAALAACAKDAGTGYHHGPISLEPLKLQQSCIKKINNLYRLVDGTLKAGFNERGGMYLPLKSSSVSTLLSLADAVGLAGQDIPRALQMK